MPVKAGDRMPEGSFGIMTDTGPASLSTDELFAGKKVILFAVPGAFTPTCSRQHLPGFIEHADKLAAKGVDAIACMSVNDVFVMAAWGQDVGAGDSVMMLADGNADYARALGLESDSSAFGMGIRSRRFAIVVDDGMATAVAVDEPGSFDVSSAEAILAQL